MLHGVLGLGSNLGDRRQTLALAVAGLERLVDVERASSLYETDPVGGPKQGPFLNAALAIGTTQSPEDLLEDLLAIERRLGRERRERWGPRTLDLDILWMDDVALARPTLSIPHPRLRERAFALLPLVEVAPAATDPISGGRYGDMVGTLSIAGLRKVAGPEWLRHG